MVTQRRVIHMFLPETSYGQIKACKIVDATTQPLLV